MNKNKYPSVAKLFPVSLLATSILCSGYASAALEEIVVTANKRAESANDIGLSIAAVSGSKLKEQKLTSLEEITSVVPGLVFATSQQNTPILTLRGVGFNESSLGVYPATSLYVDEIPLPFPVMAAHSSYDLERVEVLKGPQGVLFGQNSTGGAVNFIAAKPTDEFSYGGDISYGRFKKIETNAFVSGRFNDLLSARLAVQNVRSDDWQQSVTSDQENGEESYTAGRLQLRLEPTDTATININLNGWRDKSDPQAMQFIAATPKRFDQAPGNAATQFGIPFAKEDNRSADWSAIDRPSGDKQFSQLSVRGDFELNDSMTMTALLAHSDYEQDQVQDGDGHHLVTAGFVQNKGEIQSTFAEIRLASNNDSGVRWVLGANYEDSSTEEDQLLQFSDNTTYRPQTFFISRTGSLLEQEIESYAVFGNVDYDFTEDLTLKLGARYTDTTIDADSCNYAAANAPGTIDSSGGSGSNVAAIFNFLGGLSGNPFTPIGLDDCFTLNAPPLQGVPGIPFVSTLAEDNISWRVGLDYQFNDDTLLYANISQGYKAGSYPTLAANDYSQLQPVTEESVLSYEAGFKKSLADSRVQWNGAIFYYDYEDKQVRGKIQIPLFGPLDRLVNVPESTITGLETDVVAQLTDKLTLTAAITYVDSEVDKYTGFDVYGVERDLSGNDIPFTPEITYSLDLDYRTPLGDGTFFMGLNVVGQSDSDAVFDGDDLDISDAPAPGSSPINGVDAGVHKSITEKYFVVESYATLGARIGYESDDGRWKAMLWGKNITDEYYYNSVVASSEGGARVAGKPRTFGITLGYTY